MKLYHGTSARQLKRILVSGLEPRKERKGNWVHTVESSPHCVYLTNAYPHHFARVAATRRDDRCAIVEIDTDRLDSFYLLPDEDALAHVARKGTGKTLLELSEHYREHLLDYAGTEAWEKSLKLMGNCCYFGAIPAAAITRAASFERSNVITYADPVVSPANFGLMGDYYKGLVARTFGEPATVDALGHDPNRAKLLALRFHKGEPSNAAASATETLSSVAGQGA